MDFYRQTKNVALTCRRFGISRQTFYRWYRRYDLMDLTSPGVAQPSPPPMPPADLVEVDTMDVRPIPGKVFKQFTARDLVSRWDVVQAHGRATAQSATAFLDTLAHRMPFPIRALQVDGGSEFAAEFEQVCQQRGLHLFVLPPRSPKLNGAVERANRTHTEEFYQVTPYSLELRQLNRELRHWERIYNTVRPHQALGYLTPHQFLQQLSSQRKE
jgi:transposase InsO family protein